MSEMIKNYDFLKKKYFSSKCSYGHVECIFGEAVGIILLTVQKFFNHSPITIEINFFSKFFFPKVHFFQKVRFDTKNAVLTTLPKNFSPNVQLFFPQNRKLVQKYFFKPNYFSSKSSYEHLECNFDNPAENFPPKIRKFFANSPKKVWKVLISFKILKVGKFAVELILMSFFHLY